MHENTTSRDPVELEPLPAHKEAVHVVRRPTPVHPHPFRQFLALTRKNVLLKWHDLPGTLVEMAVPVCIVLALSFLNTAVLSSAETSSSLNLDAAVEFDQEQGMARVCAFVSGSDRRVGFLPFRDGHTVADALRVHMETQYPCLAGRTMMFSSVTEMEDYTRATDYATTSNPGLFAAVEITSEDMTTWGYPLWEYTLHLNATGSDLASSLDLTKFTAAPQNMVDTRSTFEVDSEQVAMYPTNFLRYVYYGQLALQLEVEFFLGNRSLGKPSPSPPPGAPPGSGPSPQVMPRVAPRFVPFPTPPYDADAFYLTVATGIGIYLMLAMMYTLSRVVKTIVEEKERRLRHSLHTMGLSLITDWLAWLFLYSIYFLVIAAGCTLVGATTMYVHSDLTVILTYFYLYGMSVFGFAALCSVFFDNPRVATIISMFAFLLSYMPSYAVANATTAQNYKYLACASSGVCTAIGGRYILRLESVARGLHWDTLDTTVENVRFDHVLSFMALDAVVYFVLAVFIDVAGPSMLHALRSCRRKCQRSPSSRASGPAANLRTNDSFWVPLSPEQMAAANSSQARLFEAVAPDRVPDVAVRGLSKTFYTGEGEVEAVRGLSLDLFEGEIFVLLGHSGSGKSVTLNMLSAEYAPTAGDASVYGNLVSSDMANVRSLLGMCPQRNRIWDNLSVREHLVLAANVKAGVPALQVFSTVDDMLEHTGMVGQQHVLAKSLSGGQKRRLLAAMALLGDSKVIFLDEPSTGVDPYSRRQLWDLLLSHKAGRVIVVTTHFLDEADFLGDRVAIMHGGSIRCCGSPLFLKAVYGVGYTLTVTKVGATEAMRTALQLNSDSEEPDIKRSNTGLASLLSQRGQDEIAVALPSTKAIEGLIKSHVSSSTLLSDAAGEVAFRLPFEGVAEFPALLDDLESRGKAELGVQSFGLSVTTLEEVFLRVEVREEDVQERALDRLAQRGLELQRQHTASRLEQLDPDSAQVQHVETKPVSWGGMYKALMIKRWHNMKRDRRAVMWLVIFPLLVLSSGIFMIRLSYDMQLDSVQLNTSPFNNPHPLPYLDRGSTSAYSHVLSTLDKLPPYNNAPVAVELDASVTTEVALNTTGVAMAQYLLESGFAPYSYEHSRYIALVMDDDVAAETASSSSTSRPIVFHNTSAANSLPIGVNVLNTMLFLRGMLARFGVSGFHECGVPPFPCPPADHDGQLSNDDGSVKESIPIGILGTMAPFPQAATQVENLRMLNAMIVALGAIFAPAAFAYYVLKERDTGAKHLQFLSGVSVGAYWASSFTFDFVNYLATAAVTLIVFAAFDFELLLTPAETVVSLLLFGASVIPFSYYLAADAPTAVAGQNKVLLINVLTGPSLTTLTLFMDSISGIATYSEYAKYAFRLSPTFAYAEIMLEMLAVYVPRANAWVDTHAWGWEDTLRNFTYMGVVGVVSAIALLIKERRERGLPGIECGAVALCSRRGRKFPVHLLEAGGVDGEDPFVTQESERVLDGMAEHDTVVLRRLRKLFPAPAGDPDREPRVAVADLTFGLPQGQCFGLPGLNGCGKSTTLRMITADAIPTSGSVTVGGFDVVREQDGARRLIGYCPQYGGLIDTLTAYETLELYGRLKGIAEHDLPLAIKQMVKSLMLEKYADLPCGGYSGGNKRKLSVAIALLGNPRVIILDEPSSGMDPVSRRSMWEVITATLPGKVVLITSHSMEEIAALCQRIGIMVDGRLSAIGSINDLKDAYGNGVELHATCSGSVEPLRELLEQQFAKVTLIEQHGSLARLLLSGEEDEPVRLAEAFAFIEEHKEALGVVHYSLSESTLEQIFVSFARKARWAQESRQVQHDAQLARQASLSGLNLQSADVDESVELKLQKMPDATVSS